MTHYSKKHVQVLRSAIGVSLICVLASCGTAKVAGKVATAPVKAVWYTGKGVYLTGKGVYKVGEGIYRVGSVPVKITRAAMNTTSDVLLLTTRVMTTAGSIAETTRKIRRAELEAELAALKTTRNIVEVIVDIPRPV
jgi:hypothetical protein